MRKLIVLALLIAPLAIAQPVMLEGISWTAPTERTDGTVLQPQEIAGYTVHCGTGSGAWPMTLDAGTATSVSRAALVAGMGLDFDVTYFCALTVTDTGGQESAFSEEVNFTLTPAAPRPPADPVAR